MSNLKGKNKVKKILYQKSNRQINREKLQKSYFLIQPELSSLPLTNPKIYGLSLKTKNNGFYYEDKIYNWQGRVQKLPYLG